MITKYSPGNKIRELSPSKARSRDQTQDLLSMLIRHSCAVEQLDPLLKDLNDGDSLRVDDIIITSLEKMTSALGFLYSGCMIL